MSFAALPYELQTFIISQCLHAAPPQQTSAFSTITQLAPLDVKQALVLSVVSERCRAITATVLYRHIWVSRPSALRQLHSTFNSRPDLAALVVSIHLGPDCELPAQWWPLVWTADYPYRLYVKTSLSDEAEASLLPLWCKPKASFCIARPRRGCKYVAVDNAIESAMAHLDVEPRRRGFSKSEVKIGLRAWTTRLLLLQAALDLYLAEMRRVEDLEGYDVTDWPQGEAHRRLKKPDTCKNIGCEHYPGLAILVGPLEASQSGDASHKGRTLVITEAQLWQHLQRRGGSGDHFDNLLFLTRSSRLALDLSETEWRRVRLELGGPHTTQFSDTQWRYDHTDPTERSEPSSTRILEQEEMDQMDWSGEDPYSNYADSDDGNIEDSICDRPLAKVEDFLDMARFILSLTTQVRSVSLTSYLYRALSSIPCLELLRSVNIGPKPSWWQQVLPLDLLARTTSLISLRVAGRISNDDATRICNGLPLLRKLEWVWPQDYMLLKDVRDVIFNLQGRVKSTSEVQECLQESADGLNEGRSGTSSSDGSERAAMNSATIQQPDGPDLASPGPLPSSRRTLILLDPDNALYAGPTAELSHAWDREEHVPGTLHRIKISFIEPVWQRGVNFSESEAAAELAALVYAGGRKWWEEGSLDAKGGGDEGD